MKRNPLWAPLIILCILISGLATGCKEISLMNDIVISDVVIEDLPDGTYEWYEDYNFVTARVVVTVQDTAIVDIQLTEHEHGPNHGAEKIIPRVLSSQSLIVDVVSGSTYSSKVILKALENALSQGQQ